jgi:hypothetical protein
MQWLFQRMPLLAAYREPEKWSALWVLAVVVLGAEGLGVLLAKAASARPRASALAGLAAAGVGLSVLLPNGVAAVGELPATIVPVEYPGSWIGAAAFLQQRVSASQPVVVLPWVLYEPLPFTGNRLVSNPAPVIFPGHLLSSNDAQITGASNQTGPDNLAEAALHPQTGSCELSSKLRQLGVKWAIVEPAPGGRTDLGALLGCGFTIRYGHPSGVELLSR